MVRRTWPPPGRSGFSSRKDSAKRPSPDGCASRTSEWPLPDAGLPFQTTYDGANRAVVLRMAQPLEAFRTVKVEILDGLKGFDGAPVTPWTISFSVGG